MKVGTIASVMLCLVMTTGCGSMDFGSRPKVQQQADMSAYFKDRLADGREHLEAGRPTKAIEAFRQASYDPAVAPEAFNGMAVAYSQLGRDDVARELFVRAVDLDPTDQRFARNLAKVDERIMLAQQVTLSEITPVDTAETDPAAGAVAAAPIVSPRTGTMRVARAKEVFIRTLPVAETPRAIVAGRKPEGAIVRSALITVTPKSRSAYPVRIELTSPRKGAAATWRSAGKTSFPIRLSLKDK